MVFLLLSVFYESGLSQRASIRSLLDTTIGPMHKMLDQVGAALDEGSSLAEAFRKGGANEEHLIYIEAGGDTGRVAEYYRKISANEAYKLDKSISQITGSINFLLLVMVGAGVIAFYGLTIYPIYGIVSSM